MLLKKERNSLFEIIVGFNLNPSDFLEQNKADSYTISQSDTPFSFSVTPAIKSFVAVASPEIGLPRYEGTKTPRPLDWNSILGYFNKWVVLLREELDTPDLFAEFRANAALFISQSDAPDEKFTNIELRELEGQLRQIDRGLTSLGLPAEAQKALSSITQEAPEKASRFTKKEWQSWFIGAVVSQVTNLALSPEHVAAVYQLLKTTFTGLLQLH
jgi:hypothetical protein